MRTKFSGILTLLLAFIVQISFAQDKTITGTVSDNTGLPLPGVNIVIKGTQTGTQTDFDGNYTISAATGQTLQFSYVGFQTQEIAVGASNTINVSLEQGDVLDEVIVTAQGIKREKKALGYAVSTVKQEDLEQKSEGDIGRILQGKAAGVQITATNGVSGSGTNFIIRGYTSISGSNQPLFIVDGVPFDGGANEQTSFFDGVTESSRFLDLDPNNIESVEVLKGLSATVLYGEDGRNGVVLITTKNASSASVNKKLEVSVAQSYFITNAVLPDYQDEFGGGFHQNLGFFFSNWGPAFDADISQNNLFIRQRADGVSLIRHPFSAIGDQSLIAGFEDLAASEYEYRPYDSVDQFFRTGSAASTSVNLRGGSEKVNYNVNYGYLEDQGFTPGNRLLRNNLGIGGNAKLSNNITVAGTLNYSKTSYATPPIAASAGSGTIGGGASVFGDVLYTPRSVDLTGIPFQAADGRSVYYRSGNDIQNPRWTVANARTTQDTDRIFGNASVTYNLKENMNLTYRFGLDTYTEFNTSGQNRGGVDGNVLGFYRTIQARNSINDHSVIFNYSTDITDDLDLNLIVGGQARRDLYRQEGAESTQQLAFGVLEHFNFVNASTVNSFSGNNIAFQSEENRLGIYGDATLGYKNYLYLGVSARNDWSSTLEQENYSLFYPATSVSFIPTAAFPDLRSDGGLNYLKMRLGYGTSAGFPLPYGTRNTLVLASRGFVTNDGTVLSQNSVSNRLGNPNLTPERVKEIEAGIETRFFNNRATLNVSVFKKNSEDLITDQFLDPSTGFTVQRINAGELETKGIEADFSYAAIRNDDGFNWNVSGNVYIDQNEVLSLPEGTEAIELTGFAVGRPVNTAIVGQPFGVFRGTAVQRDENGNFVVGSNGYYLQDPEEQLLGDPNPDWTGTLNNSFSYKGFSFNASVQFRHGGDIFSQTAGSLTGRGVVGVPIDRENTFILPGVLQDGSPNNIQITATDVYFNNLGFGPSELQIYDGTTLRLAEVSLGYAVPSKFLDRTPFGSLSVTLSGSNLYYKAFNFPDNTNFDTNTLSTGVGNGQGIDFITGPSARRYGVSVKATF